VTVLDTRLLFEVFTTFDLLSRAAPWRWKEQSVKKQVMVSGDHGIGQMVHVVHMSDDAQELRGFYERVFGAFVYMGVAGANYLPVEDRYATLMMVGDLCVETMAPRKPVDANRSVGKFYTKFGRHLHSVGYKVEDLAGLVERLQAKGVHLGKPGGARLEVYDPQTGYLVCGLARHLWPHGRTLRS
jgi:hypothetical protein